jgi:hypothetical protein
MGGAELRGSYENYYNDISYLLFVTDRRAAKYPFSSHSCRLWLVLYPAFGSTSVDHVSRKLLVDQALCSAIFC